MAKVILALDKINETLSQRVHPLVGPPTLTSTLIEGGAELATVPPSCRVWIDRRLTPGERPADALQEVENVLEGLRQGADKTKCGHCCPLWKIQLPLARRRRKLPRWPPRRARKLPERASTSGSLMVRMHLEIYQKYNAGWPLFSCATPRWPFSDKAGSTTLLAQHIQFRCRGVNAWVTRFALSNRRPPANVGCAGQPSMSSDYTSHFMPTLWQFDKPPGQDVMSS
ncbi:peptidase dimerization domain-containing protein [Mesorhizobium sp. M1312]|uniref:peptidase dimerization domain-containing protein n=1 Tax=unclassified Mesorhizobium TaxID=325217 RepID=UPI00333B0F2B